ncbi:MAG: M20/M25/M40 family metallo-hydrolase [Pleurocapsa minor GSE-CHR-MK-17-07R]|jgi:acetylornithine deacetylase/succinyl-diaminopimelate desuccinylase-like protein|nr:M20/M25/M40 family metallo-hydrolase [Pleurocapsa minor GSE-CHR-MK 17-07R]
MPSFEHPVEQALIDVLERLRPGMIGFCQRLIQTPSVNGEHDEVHLARVIAAEAEALGLHAEILGENPARPNVIVSTHASGETGLLLLGHLDTVPPGDASAWTYPPFSGTLADGRLHGRGAIDTKGGMAASVYALAALKATPGALPQGSRAVFIGVPDEETGATGTLGISYLAARGRISGRGALYAYSGSEIVLGHRGLLRYRVRCHGHAIHTGAHEWQEGTLGANAVTGMARFLLAAEALAFDYSRTPYFERFRTIVTPGTMIQGGVSINIVPAACEALIDIRTTPEQDAASIEDAFADIFARVGADAPGLRFELEPLNVIPAVCSDPAASVFRILADVTAHVRGGVPAMTVAGPANEGYLLIGQGIPTVCGFGPTGDNAHAANEYLELEGLHEAAQIFALTARRLSVEGDKS